jgi:preprotein translocase subunit SecD
VLTMGMAVDANVLIFSRIREELARGVAPQMAIHAGFERAFVTILDSNLTTLIVAVILYAVGTGPVKGFAVTLSVGILTSMFTAIMGTRALINLFYGGRRVRKLSIGGRQP